MNGIIRLPYLIPDQEDLESTNYNHVHSCPFLPATVGRHRLRKTSYSDIESLHSHSQGGSGRRGSNFSVNQGLLSGHQRLEEDDEEEEEAEESEEEESQGPGFFAQSPAYFSSSVGQTRKSSSYASIIKKKQTTDKKKENLKKYSSRRGSSEISSSDPALSKMTRTKSSGPDQSVAESEECKETTRLLSSRLLAHYDTVPAKSSRKKSVGSLRRAFFSEFGSKDKAEGGTSSSSGMSFKKKGGRSASIIVEHPGTEMVEMRRPAAYSGGRRQTLASIKASPSMPTTSLVPSPAHSKHTHHPPHHHSSIKMLWWRLIRGPKWWSCRLVFHSFSIFYLRSNSLDNRLINAILLLQPLVYLTAPHGVSVSIFRNIELDMVTQRLFKFKMKAK